MTKLVGSGTAGNFVHNTQVMDDKFKNVSKKWSDQCISIDDGISKIVDEQRNREDINTTISKVDFGVNDDNQVVVKMDDREFVPTEKALADMARWCDQTSISFVNRITAPVLKPNGKIWYQRDRQDAETLCTVLKNGKRRIERDKEFLFRTYNDGTLRAMLSDRYAIVDNVWYMNVIKEAIPDGLLSHWRGNADTIYGNVLLPNSVREEFDSDYGAMISCKNSEIGLSRIGQKPSLFRAICMNGMIHGSVEGKRLDKVHRGVINLMELRQSIIENIHEQIPLSQEIFKKLMENRNKIVGNNSLKNILTIILGEGKFNPQESQQVVKEFSNFESGERNLFGILNSMTRASQTFEAERWIEVDEYAGKINSYDTNAWDRIISKSRNVVAKDIEAVFGV